MKVVLDTNVFVSGVFFAGLPFEILRAWRDGVVELVLSQEIFDEYGRTGSVLARRFSGVDLASALALVAANATFYRAPVLEEPVCDDPDDDMFLACALAGGCKIVVSGDKALLRTSGYRGILVLRPRELVDRYLKAT